jgi:hypothetical protein
MRSGFPAKKSLRHGERLTHCTMADINAMVENNAMPNAMWQLNAM